MIARINISTKKKLNESSSKPTKKAKKEKMVKENINEYVQVGDDVIYNKMKGNVIGAVGDEVLVQTQYSTHLAKQADVKTLADRENNNVKPPFKIDEKTQKVLFEQYIKCGLYMNNIPVKTTNCFVKYSDFRDAKHEDSINVMVEGRLTMVERSSIKIYEDVNEFANPENYVEGVIIDEASEEAVENCFINVEDYTNSYGEADMVRVLRGSKEDPTMDSLPKAHLRTLSV